MPIESPIPVTLVTGFLGSGKTTLANRILAERSEEKIAVIENEFGAVSIDHSLLLHNAEIVEINDGCICCNVRGDLIRILGDLARRRNAGELAFDRVLIETTGLAAPSPVIQTFFVDPVIRAHYAIDAMLTVIDAEHGMAQLDRHPEAREQAGFADVLLLSKRDRVDDQAFSQLIGRLIRINSRARIFEMTHGEVPLQHLIDVQAFSLSALPGLDARQAHGTHDHHHDDIATFVYRNNHAFDEGRLEDFLARTIARHHADMLRYKGILNLTGEPHMVALQGVHMTVYGDRIRPWPHDSARASTLVFIGRNLPEAEIRAGLDTCIA